ncbi:MAG: MotA/TolQ/ExbB proton channel family protein [Deltaproteobacteria bacterium]|nr:MotA/TolQ/ExbB proton channel family protein [Deltaproteobacteria bacterium]
MNLLGITLLLAQAATEVPVETTDLAATNHSLFSLLIHANFVVQLTLLILFAFSVVSWAIITAKHRQLKSVKELSTKFYDHFWQATTVDGLINKGTFRKSPAFNVFKQCIDTLRDHSSKDDIAVVQREVQRKTEEEIEDMEYGVPFLAITGSSATFIGLFGTVWGIMNAFWKIGRTGASSLAIVGPHIAEALIATAVGLAAAIPAMIFYNIYVNRIRILSKDLESFSDDLMTRVKKEYFHGRS